MSRFIETIRAENGLPGPLEHHQERVDRTLRDWEARINLDLPETLENISIPPFPVSKLRVTYGLDGLESIDITEYSVRPIQSIGIASVGNREYLYKLADRDWIYDLVRKSGCDEVIMIKDGFVTDASIANLAFYDGRQWITPDTPLLSGTRRRYLLDSGILHEAPVRIEDLPRFTKIRLVNAMIHWDESPELPIGLLVH